MRSVEVGESVKSMLKPLLDDKPYHATRDHLFFCMSDKVMAMCDQNRLSEFAFRERKRLDDTGAPDTSYEVLKTRRAHTKHWVKQTRARGTCSSTSWPSSSFRSRSSSRSHSRFRRSSERTRG